jgi:hypothetical protein
MAISRAAAPIDLLQPSNQLSRKSKPSKEACYVLPLLFTSDLVLYPSRVHLARVRNLFMLTAVLRKG